MYPDFEADGQGEHGHKEEEEEVEEEGGARAPTYQRYATLLTFSISSSSPDTCDNGREPRSPALLPLKRLLVLRVLPILLGLSRPHRHRPRRQHRRIHRRFSPLHRPTLCSRIPVVDSGGSKAASAAEDRLLPLLLLLRFWPAVRGWMVQGEDMARGAVVDARFGWLVADASGIVVFSMETHRFLCGLNDTLSKEPTGELQRGNMEMKKIRQLL